MTRASEISIERGGEEKTERSRVAESARESGGGDAGIVES